MTITTDTMRRPVKTAAAHTVETVSRKELNGLLFDLYGCHEAGMTNDVVAETTIDLDNMSLVEVFNSPAGLIVAIHHGLTDNERTLIRPAATGSD